MVTGQQVQEAVRKAGISRIDHQERDGQMTRAPAVARLPRQSRSRNADSGRDNHDAHRTGLVSRAHEDLGNNRRLCACSGHETGQRHTSSMAMRGYEALACGGLGLAVSLLAVGLPRTAPTTAPPVLGCRKMER